MGWERASARDGVVRGRERESGGIGTRVYSAEDTLSIWCDLSSPQAFQMELG